MIQKPMDVLQDYPVRRSYKQKSAFLADATAYLQSLRYSVSIETGKQNTRNIVVGDPNKARFLITAHYDTPATSLFPNLLLPTNRIAYFAYQMFVILAYMLMASVLCLPFTLLTKDATALFAIWYAFYMAMVLLMRFGPANRNNANDNTSGVISLLEIAKSMPEGQRNQVCFVLFDQEEKGLVGSDAYLQAHKDVAQKQIVLNMDCVGDGDTILLEPVKKARENEKLMDLLRTICGPIGGKQIRLAEGKCTGSSDHKKFPLGVGVKAVRYRKGIGYYCGRIHTNQDTILDQTNINILRAALISLVCSAQIAERNDIHETL